MAGQAVASGMAKVGGVMGGAGSIFKNILALFLLKWRVYITIIFLLIHLFAAVGASIQQRNFSPLIYDVGGRIVSGDETQYWMIKDIESNGWKLYVNDIIEDDQKSNGFIDTIKLIFGDIKIIGLKIRLAFDLVANLWYVYMLGYVFYLIFDKMNTSGKVFSVLLAIMMVIGLQMIYGNHRLYVEYDCGPDNLDNCLSFEERQEMSLFALTPLKGTWATINHLFITRNLGRVFIQDATPLVEEIEQMTNQSLNITQVGVF